MAIQNTRFSSGIAAYRYGKPIEDTVERADKAPYQAKAARRK